MYEMRIADAAKDFRRPVGGMIVYDYYIEVEIGALGERTPDGIMDGTLAVADRDDDAGFDRKWSGRRRNLVEARLQPCADALEMRRRDLFHLDLIIAIARIYIVELLFAGGPVVD